MIRHPHPAHPGRATVKGWTRAELEHALDAVLDEIDAVLEANDFAAAAAIDGRADALTARLARMMSAPALSASATTGARR